MNKKYIVNNINDDYYKQVGELFKEGVLGNGDPMYCLLFPDGVTRVYFVGEIDLLWKAVK